MALYGAQILLSIDNLGYAEMTEMTEMTEFPVSNCGLRLSLSISPSLPGRPPSNTDDGRFPEHQAQTTLGRGIKGQLPSHQDILGRLPTSVLEPALGAGVRPKEGPLQSTKTQ